MTKSKGRRGQSVQAYVSSDLKQEVLSIVGATGNSESEVAAYLLEAGLQSQGLPILGSIPAGDCTEFGEEFVEGYINPGTALHFDRATDFFVRVKGISMTNPQRRGGDIRDGEFALLRRGDGWHPGNVVAARIEGRGVTLKRMAYEIGEDAVKLEPLNEDIAPIVANPSDVEILAVCVGKATKTADGWAFSSRCG